MDLDGPDGLIPPPDLAPGGAVGLGSAPAPPPDPILPVGASLQAKFGNGSTLSFYFKDSRYEATCNNKDHVPKCRLTRYLPSKAMAAKKPEKNNPCGLLTKWALDGHEFTSAAEHHHVFYVLGMSQEDRQSARDHLRTREGGLQLLQCEFCNTDGLAPEPENSE